jgi:iron uptake system component EfeO
MFAKRPLAVASPPGVLVLLAIVLVCLGGCGGSEAETTRAESEVTVDSAGYRAYLSENVATLETWVGQIRSKIKRRLTTGAQSRYASARVPYGHLEPVAGSMELDRKIDGATTGFHRLERALFTGQLKQQRMEIASRLLADVEQLRRRLRTTPLSFGSVADGANRTLKEIVASELRLKEERHSKIDLVDAAADLEGVEAAFDLLEPVLSERDPQLAKQITLAFAKTFKAIKPFGTAAREPDQPYASSPGTSFLSSFGLELATLRPLAAAVANLSQLFAKVSAVANDS